MRQMKIAELFRKEDHLRRGIERKKEHYEELKAKATSSGSFRYDQEKVTGSAPDGSRQERIVIEYVELEKEIREMETCLEEMQKVIRLLIAQLPPRERRLMRARHIDHEEVESIMEKQGIKFETYKLYHKNAMKRMERLLKNNA